jgi:hypothetical protein
VRRRDRRSRYCSAIFNTAGLDVLKRKLEAIIAEVRPLHPKAKIELQIIEQYRNMKDYMGKDPRVLDCMWEATKRAGLDPSGCRSAAGRTDHA